ncbi:MAG: hypothetical protein SGJ15_08735 [Bacteroidota bacterium]|nr:hypothetical protein [Bacteroidota bacterium]
MKAKFTLLSLSLLAMTLLCFISCKKKKQAPVVNNYYSTSTTPAQQKISLPITNGSYWVYDMDYIDMNTSSRTFLGRDSFVVENDVQVNNKMYKQIKKYSVIGNNPTIEGSIEGLYRDSSGFNVTPNGTFFDQSDFTKTTISNFVGGSIETKLLHSGKIYTTYMPFDNTINLSSKYQAVTGNTGARYMNNYYCNKIGLVQATSFFLTDTDHYIEQTLIRYSIK